MTKLAFATIPILLASCGPQGESPAPSPAAGPTFSVARDEPRPVADFQLAGEYRVAGVDGGDIDQPYAITASITATRIHVTADCLNFAWAYTIEGDHIATSRAAVEGCGRGPTLAEDAVVAALDSAVGVARTPANAIELRGGGRSVTLFLQ